MTRITDALLGKRFSYALENDLKVDITVIAIDPVKDSARVHMRNGVKGDVAASGLLRALDAGLLIETLLPPFVIEDTRRTVIPIRRNGRTINVPAENIR